MRIDFESSFQSLTGNAPYPWQRRLFERLVDGKVPRAIDIPTGLGKTSTMVLWLLALASGANLPRRLVYVVDRRVVVDQATDVAMALREKLEGAGPRSDLGTVSKALGLTERNLAISTLRGRYLDNGEWLEDPVAPAIVVGTVDMIGSRLLFQGYSVSRRMRPNHAGLLGCDVLVMLDEAHLCRPFEALLRTIEQRHPHQPEGQEDSHDFLSGPLAAGDCPPPFHVMSLSATLGYNSHGAEETFGLSKEDRANQHVKRRVNAVKELQIKKCGKLPLHEALAKHALELVASDENNDPSATRVLVYCNLRSVAESVMDQLQKASKEGTALHPIYLVGGRRIYERQQSAKELKDNGLIGGDTTADHESTPVIVVATSAGEVGVDMDADHIVCDVVAWERMVQRFGRVNRSGTRSSTILVVDHDPEQEQKSSVDQVNRHKAVRALIKRLPKVSDSGNWLASPAALESISGPENQKYLTPAVTPSPLYPRLTRALLDAWSMTSLTEHTGRPEVGPWLRGWEEDEPQTTVVWRSRLPFQVTTNPSDPPVVNTAYLKGYLEAVPPQSAERLEARTRDVHGWLRDRLKQLSRAPGKAESAQDQSQSTAEDTDEPNEDQSVPSLPPLRVDDPIVVVLDRDGSLDGEPLTIRQCRADQDGRISERSLASKTLVVDARIGGLKDGLLDKSHDEAASTMDNNWGAVAEDEASDSNQFEAHHRINLISDERRRAHLSGSGTSDGGMPEEYAGWWIAFDMPYRTNAAGEPTEWLTVWRPKKGGEERGMSSSLQTLKEHQGAVVEEVDRIAGELRLPAKLRETLRLAASMHDEGKRMERWQRSFSAPVDGGPYAKTPGPLRRTELAGYRHEFQSVLDMADDGRRSEQLSDSDLDLALHLVAAHHGYARPVISPRSCDSLPPSKAALKAAEIAMRFARVQRAWGPWGLAWWEALLRASDRKASG